jgi:hypothetical protein
MPFPEGKSFFFSPKLDMIQTYLDHPTHIINPSDRGIAVVSAAQR